MAENSVQSASLLSRFLARVTLMVARRPRLFMWPVLMLACAAAGITVLELQLRTGRDALVDPATEFSKNWKQYTEDFSSHGDLVVVVRTGAANRPLIESALERIADRIRHEPEYFKDILYRIDRRKLRSKELQLLSAAELRGVSRRVGSYASTVRDNRWDRIRTESMSRRLREDFRQAREQQQSEVGLLQHANRFAVSLTRFLDGMENGASYDSATFPSPWKEVVPVRMEHAAEDANLAYLMNHEGTHGMLKAVLVPQESDLDPNAASIQRLRAVCREVEASYADTGAELKVMVTGIPVLEHDELRRAGHDVTLASALAMVVVGALLSFGFRSVRHPMLIVLTLVVSVACTFGVATLAIGHLNLLSICFVAILIGLGVDFGVHFLSRYLYVRQNVSNIADALQQTALDSGSGILVSGLTTALAFGSAALTGFPGIAEFGLIAAAGILVCAAFTFVFLPALIAISDAGTPAKSVPQPFVGKIFRRLIGAVPLIIVGVSLIGVVGLGSRAVKWNSGQPELDLAWDGNLMHLHDPHIDSVQAQQEIHRQTGESLLYAVAMTDSPKEALQLSNQLSRLPTVSHVKELASYLQPLDQQRATTIQNLRQTVAGLSATVPGFRQTSSLEIAKELDRLYRTVTASHHPAASVPAGKLDQFLDRIVDLTSQQRTALFNAYQDLLAGSFLYRLERVANGANLERIRLAELPKPWRDRLYRSVEGQDQYLVKIYPQADLWDEVNLAAFVEEIRTVAPDVTGIPVQNYESTRQIQASWQSIAIYSLAAISMFLLFDFLRPGQKLLTLMTPLLVTGFIGYMMHQRSGELDPHLLLGIYLAMVAFIALVVDFRNLRDTVIALLPAVVGAILMAGTMSVLQVSLNPLNLVVLPLVLGIGVDDGIHIVHDYRRQLKSGSGQYTPSGETLSGVILTSLTTMVGFGSLLIAGHQGLVSIGLVMAIGVASCLAVALIPLPALLTLVAKYQPPSLEPLVSEKPKPKKKRAKVTAAEVEDDSEEEATRPLTRREKRRLARAA